MKMHQTLTLITLILTACTINKSEIIEQVENNKPTKIMQLKGEPIDLANCFIESEKAWEKAIFNVVHKFAKYSEEATIKWEMSHNKDNSVVIVNAVARYDIEVRYKYVVRIEKQNDKVEARIFTGKAEIGAIDTHLEGCQSKN